MEVWNGRSDEIGTFDTIESRKRSRHEHILSFTDPVLRNVLEGKKQLQVELEVIIEQEEEQEQEQNKENRQVVELFMAACDGDLVTFENIARSNKQLINQLYPSEERGFSCLIYGICFGHYGIVESILANHEGEPDLCDSVVKYTPLMWAVYCDELEMVKVLLHHQADPFLSPQGDDRNSASILNVENTEMYEYFKSHNLLNRRPELKQGEEVYQDPSFNPVDQNLAEDLSDKIKLETVAAKTAFLDDEEQEGKEVDEETELAYDPYLANLKDFDYEKLIPDEYIKFTDSDIPSMLDYIFDLRTKKLPYQHETKIPAAILFQLMRYSFQKVASSELTDFLFDCFTARLRSVTNTKSGVFNMAISSDNEASMGSGDIVLQSYWLSVLQFLHFYFCKSKFYSSFPRYLQEIINLNQSLIASLSFSINSRLNLLLDDCMLNFTNLVDVSNVLYAKDWNFFKFRKKIHPNTYEDIFDMLYPPSQDELIKPSPIKYIQVLSALDYVLKIHNVDHLIKLQVFSQVFYYINAVVFNKIMTQSKYCTRSKAIQIRLNISTLEDWLRSHNYKTVKPEISGKLSFLLERHQESFKLQNLLEETDESNDPHSLSFYYNSLFHVGKSRLEPTIELLQWLQCMTLLNNEENLIMTINQFETLNYYQIVKIVTKLYKYEVDEPKMPKALVNFLKSLQNERGQEQVSKNKQHYMTQTTFLLKEVYIYLNPNYVFGVALPNYGEVIRQYGSGIGGVKILRARKFQPSLPIEIMDDIDIIITQNRQSTNDTYDYEQNGHEQEGEGDSEGLQDHANQGDATVNKVEPDFKGDELFKQVKLPSSLAHKHWGEEDIDKNPW